MKKTLLILLILLLPSFAHAFSVSLTATTTSSSGFVFPATVIGNYFALQIPYIYATSTTASSTFSNGINLTKGCFSSNGSCLTGLSPNSGGVQVMPDQGSFTATVNAATPAFAGQIGINLSSTIIPGVFFSLDTTKGNWSHAPQFPAGVLEFGDQFLGDPNLVETIFNFNAGAAGSLRGGDSYITSRNWSNSPFTSGNGFCGALMATDPNQPGSSTDLTDNSSCFNTTPAFGAAGVVPGTSAMVFNADPVNMKAFEIDSPNIGPDGGGYSLTYYDLINPIVRFPYWAKCTYQPGDRSYLLAVSGITVTPTPGSLYRINGLNLTTCSTNVSGGSGTITSVATTTIPSSGTITKVNGNLSGNGDATINYSSFIPQNTFQTGASWNPSTGTFTLSTTTINAGTVTDSVVNNISGNINMTGIYSQTSGVWANSSNQGTSTFSGNKGVSITSGIDVGPLEHGYGTLNVEGSLNSSNFPAVICDNYGQGAGAACSLDFYTTQFSNNSGIPQSRYQAIDDGNFSTNVFISTKTPGAAANPLVNRFEVTSTGTTTLLGGFQLGPSYTPATSVAPCLVGATSWDSNFIYICTASNNWRRVTLSSF